MYLGEIQQVLGRYTESKSTLLSAEKLTKDLSLNKTKFYASILNDLGSISSILGEYLASEKYHLNAQQVLEESKVDKTKEGAITKLSLGDINFNLGNNKKSLEFINSSVNLIQKLKLEKSNYYVSSLLIQSAIYNEIGEYKLVEKNNEKCKDIMIKNNTSNTILTILINRTYLLLYKKIGKYKEGLVIVNESNNLIKKLNLEKNKINSDNYYFKGLMNTILGNYKIAKEDYKKSLDLLKNNNVGETIEYATISTRYSELLFKIDDFKNAEKELLDNDKLWEKLNLKLNQEYAYFKNALGQYYQKLGKYTLTIQSYEIAKNILIKNGTQRSNLFGFILNNLGYVLYKLKQYQAALPNLLEANELFESNLMSNTLENAVLLNNIAVCYSALKNEDKYGTFIIKSRDKYKKIGCDQTVEYMILLNNIIKYLVDKFKKENENQSNLEDKILKYVNSLFTEALNLGKKLGIEKSLEYIFVLAQYADFNKDITTLFEIKDRYQEIGATKNVEFTNLLFRLGVIGGFLNYMQESIEINSGINVFNKNDILLYIYLVLIFAKKVNSAIQLLNSSVDVNNLLIQLNTPFEVNKEVFDLLHFKLTTQLQKLLIEKSKNIKLTEESKKIFDEKIKNKNYLELPNINISNYINDLINKIKKQELVDIQFFIILESLKSLSKQELIEKLFELLNN